jgi:hypothetical protein
MVFQMRFISILVESVSEMRILVPSDRTTFSKGVIKSANGKLNSQLAQMLIHQILGYHYAHAIDSMITKAMYVSGDTPPSTPFS